MTVTSLCGQGAPAAAAWAVMPLRMSTAAAAGVAVLVLGTDGDDDGVSTFALAALSVLAPSGGSTSFSAGATWTLPAA
jgi:hypothetical protein